MTIHIQKFIDRLRGSESRGAKDFVMSIQDAKNLHADITKLLLDLQNIKNSNQTVSSSEDTLTVQMDGGTFR